MLIFDSHPDICIIGKSELSDYPYFLGSAEIVKAQ